MPAREIDVLIRGAGPVGCELAQSFQRFGCQVTLITDGAQILPKEDRDAAAVLRQRMSREGVRIIAIGIIQQVSSNGSSKRVSVATDGTTHEVECDAILVSVGICVTSAVLEGVLAGKNVKAVFAKLRFPSGRTLAISTLRSVS